TPPFLCPSTVTDTPDLQPRHPQRGKGLSALWARTNFAVRLLEPGQRDFGPIHIAPVKDPLPCLDGCVDHLPSRGAARLTFRRSWPTGGRRSRNNRAAAWARNRTTPWRPSLIGRRA